MLRSKSGVEKKIGRSGQYLETKAEIQIGLFYPGRKFMKAYDHPVRYYTKTDQVTDRSFLQPTVHETTEKWI